MAGEAKQAVGRNQIGQDAKDMWHGCWADCMWLRLLSFYSCNDELQEM
jgi:hypothetical protein